MKVSHILGVDISKDKFDVCLLHPEQDRVLAQHQFTNNLAGFQQLQRWLNRQHLSEVHACMEAASRYADALALFLHERQHPVSLVNPRRIRHFADSRLVRARNDTIDAAIIARFCATQKPRLWTPAPADVRHLHELTRLRRFFVAQRQRLQNRLHTESKTLGKLPRRHLRQLQRCANTHPCGARKSRLAARKGISRAPQSVKSPNPFRLAKAAQSRRKTQ